LTTSTPLFILGMHRSGTSVLGGTLEAMGVSFGPHLIPGGEGNAKGYFEKLDLMIINEKLLAAVGSKWWDVLPLPENWLALPAVRELAREARAILERDFAQQSLWCFKDPRCCRLLPFWQALLSEMGLKPRFIHITRNPIDVAASLQKRNQIPEPTALLLWLTHLYDAERYSRDHPRVFITMAGLLKQWRWSCSRCCRSTYPPPPSSPSPRDCSCSSRCCSISSSSRMRR